MLRSIALGIVLCGIAACSTLGGGSNASSGVDRQEMTGLEEMSLEYIKSKWGEPLTNVPKGDGRVVRYSDIHSQDEDPITRAVIAKLCDIRLDLTKELLVKAWDYENCRVVPTDK